ncbi:MAG: hypothetical protein ACREQT_00715 [Candidatus Binataceae bacterium]
MTLVLDAVWKNEQTKKTDAETNLILPTLVYDSVICCDQYRTLLVGEINDVHVVGGFRQAAVNGRLRAGGAGC